MISPVGSVFESYQRLFEQSKKRADCWRYRHKKLGYLTYFSIVRSNNLLVKVEINESNGTYLTVELLQITCTKKDRLFSAD